MKVVEVSMCLTVSELVILKRFINYGRTSVSVVEIDSGYAAKIDKAADKIGRIIDTAIEVAIND